MVKCCVNARLPGEGIDVWVLRHNGLGPDLYWGFRGPRRQEDRSFATLNTDAQVEFSGVALQLTTQHHYSSQSVRLELIFMNLGVLHPLTSLLVFV